MILPDGQAGSGPQEFEHYRDQQHRTTLYRVLANNLVRELRRSGYHGTHLLGFASEVMEAITANGWDESHEIHGCNGHGRSHGPVHSAREVLPCEVSGDSPQRPVITGPRVVLRPPAKADRGVMQGWMSDPLVRDSLIPAVLRCVIERIEQPPAADRVDLVVCLKEADAPIGLVSLHDIDQAARIAELGKVLGEPSQRGKGLAQEAARLILAYGFRVLELNRVYLRTLGGNLKNIRLNETIGFRFEGVQREAALCHGQPADVVLMGMLRHEFEQP